MVFADIDGYVFDLDGTLYLGEGLLPGAARLLAELRRREKRTLFVTNKPLYPRRDYAAKLTRLGIPTRPEEIITSVFVLGRYLARHLPGLSLYVVGEENLKAARAFSPLILIKPLRCQAGESPMQAPPWPPWRR